MYVYPHHILETNTKLLIVVITSGEWHRFSVFILIIDTLFLCCFIHLFPQEYLLNMEYVPRTVLKYNSNLQIVTKKKISEAYIQMGGNMLM